MDTNPIAWGQDALEEARLDRTRAHLLYSQSLVTFTFPVFAAIALGAVLWDLAPRHVLLGWVGTVILYSLARYGLLWRYRWAAAGAEMDQDWLNLFAMSALISGVLWGAAPILLVPYQAAGLVEFTLHNGLILLVVCGLAGGAAVAYAASLRVVFFYIVPALVSPAFYLISLGDRYNSALGGFVLLYFVFVTTAAIRMHHQLRRHFEMEFVLEQLQKDMDGHEWRHG